MISNVKEVVRICQTWLSDYSNKYRVSFVVHAHEDIASIVVSVLCKTIATSTIVINDSELIEKELKHPNKILVGSINRTNGLLNRRYSKRSNEALADIYPVYDLYESELEQISNYLNPNIKLPAPYSERESVEWAILENDRTGIVSNEELPINNEKWFGYSLKQKQIISEMHQREKKTRHKTLIGKPILFIRTANKHLFV
jgi:hypothetical protein